MHGFLYAFRWLIERLGFLCASFAMLFRDTAAKEYVRYTYFRTYCMEFIQYFAARFTGNVYFVLICSSNYCSYNSVVIFFGFHRNIRLISTLYAY